jgi:hypothetical protein
MLLRRRRRRPKRNPAAGELGRAWSSNIRQPPPAWPARTSAAATAIIIIIIVITIRAEPDTNVSEAEVERDSPDRALVGGDKRVRRFFPDWTQPMLAQVVVHCTNKFLIAISCARVFFRGLN